jgi:ketosteroid isomerase-like protein
MSGNLDLVRALHEAFNRRDFNEALRYADPAVVLCPALTGLDVQPIYQGRAAVKQFFDTITEAWESYVIEIQEAIEAPPDRVVVVERWRARGRQGIEFDFELNDVYTVRDGVLIRVDGFTDRAAALAAVGLSGAALARQPPR